MPVFKLFLPSYSSENEYLQDQLRELKDENSRLFKLVSEKEFEIKHLKRKREEERLALAGMWTSGSAEHTAASSTPGCSFVQACRAWRETQPPPKSWSCPRRTESCPAKSSERS